METSKIIRRFPLPVMEVTEDELNADATQEAAPAQFGVMAAAATSTNTKSISYTAAIINDKLAHSNAYAKTLHTYNSYSPIVQIDASSTGTSRFEANFLIVPYGDYTAGTGYGTAIINIRLWVENGIARTARVTCIAGKIDTPSLEVCFGNLKTDLSTYRLFIKSNSIRGTVIARELSLDSIGARVIYHINQPEWANVVPQWNFFPVTYDNVASEVAGLTTWVMNINQLPASTADLFTSFFKPNIGFEEPAAFLKIVESGKCVTIVLNFIATGGRPTSITTNTEVRYDEHKSEVFFDLSFIFKGKSYQILFSVRDDGEPITGSEEVEIKTL